MPEQVEIVRELYRRRASLASDKAAIVNELASRLGVSGEREFMTADQRQGSTAAGYRAPAPSMAQTTADLRASMSSEDHPIISAMAAPLREVIARPMEGAGQIAQGVRRMGSPESGETMGGISDTVRGMFNILSPYAPQMVVNSPLLATAGSIAGSTVGAKGAGALAEAVGAPKGGVELAETLGGAVGGTVGYGVGQNAGPMLRSAAAKAKQWSQSPSGKAAIGATTATAGAAATVSGHPYAGVDLMMKGGKMVADAVAQKRAAAMEAAKPAPVASEPSVLPPPAPMPEAQPMVDLPGPSGQFINTPPPPAAPGRIPAPQAPSMLDLKRAEAMQRVAQTAPAPETPRFDPRSLPPDPIRQQPWYGDAVAAMRARRVGAPEAAAPEVINPAVADESQVTMIRQMAQERTPNALADAFRNIAPEQRREVIKAFDRDVITAAQDAVRKQLEADGVTDPAIIESAVQAAKPDFAETVPTRIAAARANKASALFEVAKEAGITPAKMAKLTPAKWEELAIKAGVRKPTWTADGSATVREVIQMANEWEAKNGPIQPKAKSPKPMREPASMPLNTPEKLAAAEELRKALAVEEAPALPPYTERVGEHYRVLKPGEKVDGRVVRSSVPNIRSIEEDFTELPGIREVPMSDIFEPGVPRKKGWSVAEERRYADLAEQIKQSGEVNPLIIGIDETGPYVIEGLARVNALHDLGAKSFPAVVAEDAASIAKRVKQPAKGLTDLAYGSEFEQRGTADGSATVREVIQMANEWEAKNGPITPPAKTPKPMKEPSVSPLNTPEKLAAAEELRRALAESEAPNPLIKLGDNQDMKTPFLIVKKAAEKLGLEVAGDDRRRFADSQYLTVDLPSSVADEPISIKVRISNHAVPEGRGGFWKTDSPYAATTNGVNEPPHISFDPSGANIKDAEAILRELAGIAKTAQPKEFDFIEQHGGGRRYDLEDMQWKTPDLVNAVQRKFYEKANRERAVAQMAADAKETTRIKAKAAKMQSRVEEWRGGSPITQEQIKAMKPGQVLEERLFNGRTVRHVVKEVKISKSKNIRVDTEGGRELFFSSSVPGFDRYRLK